MVFRKFSGFFTGIVSNSCNNNHQNISDEAKMLAGLIVSAVTGGMAGLALALSLDHGVFQALLSYHLGGVVAATGFVSMSLAVAQRPT